jgi:DNA-binding protein HU-alpha
MATTTKKPTTSKTTNATTKPIARPKAATAAVAASNVLAAAIKSGADAAMKPMAVSDNMQPALNTDLKLRGLVDLVVKRTGAKKKDVKPIVEAALAIMGETVADGRDLNLPPMGKLKINRVKEIKNGQVTICKLRQQTARPKPLVDPTAEAAE